MACLLFFVFSIVLRSLSVSTAPLEPNTALRPNEQFIQNLNVTALARDTVQFCYTPHKHGEECKLYVFSTFLDTWQDSREYCQSLGQVLGVPMDLVALESKEENQLVLDHINTNYPATGWWTSGNDLDVPYLYVWASTGYGFTFYDWYPGQPGDAHTLYRADQSVVCLHYIQGEQLKWHDDVMTSQHFALCEQND